MNRFFVSRSQIEEEVIHIEGSDVNHIKNVLRMKPEEQLMVCDGESTEYTCTIREITPQEVLVEIVDQRHSQVELPNKIYLFQGLPKGDKMELIIQKAVELGVWEIIPVSTSRAVVKLDEKKAAKKVGRWQQIAESAAKQSGRMKIPQIHSVCSYKEALAYGKECCQVRLIPYELAEGMTKTRELIEKITPGQSVAVFIGPEGGFAHEEIKLAIEAQAQPITLGRRILRTETAGMTVLSILMYHMEED